MAIIQENEKISSIGKWDGTNWHVYEISAQDQLNDNYISKTKTSAQDMCSDLNINKGSGQRQLRIQETSNYQSQTDFLVAAADLGLTSVETNTATSGYLHLGYGNSTFDNDQTWRVDRTTFINSSTGLLIRQRDTGNNTHITKIPIEKEGELVTANDLSSYLPLSGGTLTAGAGIKIPIDDNISVAISRLGSGDNHSFGFRTDVNGTTGTLRLVNHDGTKNWIAPENLKAGSAAISASAETTVPSGNRTLLGSFTIPAGLTSARILIHWNDTDENTGGVGYRRAFVTTIPNSSSVYENVEITTAPAPSSYQTRTQLVFTANLQEEATFYLQAQHNCGASLPVASSINRVTVQN